MPAAISRIRSMGIANGGRRSEAGLSVWQERQKRMLPWACALLSLLVVYSVLAFLSFSGRLPFWVGVRGPHADPARRLPGLGVKTNHIEARWDEGARGEFVVGAELERVHLEGYYVFHDWDSGRGNVDHFVIGLQGVVVVETKAFTGELTCEDGRLLRNGRPIPGKDVTKQAMAEAMAVRDLLRDSSGIEAFVHSVLTLLQRRGTLLLPVPERRGDDEH